MPSAYLSKLDSEGRADLEHRLHDTQVGQCFICGDPIDLVLHAGSIDIDHVEPLSGGGKDDPSNFALTHSSCNRSKQASHLEVARVLSRFDRIRESAGDLGPNLGHVLAATARERADLTFSVEDGEVRFSLPEVGDNAVHTATLHTDGLSGLRYFFAVLPIEYLHHDDRINPRSIGTNLKALVEEFHKGRPQLHSALAWVPGPSTAPVKVFDGQHKAAAQILLGADRLPLRVFVDPDLDLLLTTNTNAGTKLRQVAFDKSIQRHLGNSLYWDRVDQYRKDHGLADDDLHFSERDLVQHFKGESREMKRYVLDSVRDSVTHDPDNALRSYIDFGGRKNIKPLSYSTVEKTFYSFFIHADLLDSPMDQGLGDGSNPRELEKEQIRRLMSLVAEVTLVDEFDPDLGTYRIEAKVQKGEDIPDGHLRAFRMMKEEILYAWLGYVRQVVSGYFIMTGKPLQEDRLFQYPIPEPLWDRIRAYLESLKKLPVWVNRELSTTVFGGKQKHDFWQTIFETGKSPTGQQVLAEPLNLMEMVNAAPPQ